MQKAQRKFIEVDHQQARMMITDLTKLVPEGHAARAIWELSGKVNLIAFEADIRTLKGKAGRAAWEPRLLLSVWAYAYQIGVSSANWLSQVMEWEPGLQWLCNGRTINVHTLCDFRAQHQEEFVSTMQAMLVTLAGEKLVDLSTVVQDGTKMEACAGKGSGHRRETIANKLEQAKAYMQKVDAASQDSARQEAAQRRAARERVERLQAAYEEVERARKPSKPDPRVSISEPEARRMRHTQDGGYRYSYNAQLSTETRGGFVVGATLTRDHNDSKQLAPALETAKRFIGKKPMRLIADAGYSTRAGIEALAKAGVELIAPVRAMAQRQAGNRQKQGVAAAFDASQFVGHGEGYTCPAGQQLVQVQQKQHHGQRTQVFAGSAEVCARCPHKQQCCPKASARRIHCIQEQSAVCQHQQRMQTGRAKQLYALRSRVAEFPHMRLKSEWGLRRFSVRGIAKATSELLLMVLAYNLSQWQWAVRKQR